MEVDGPSLSLTFTPTSACEVNLIRAWGVEFCQDNGLDSVEFECVTSHQFERRFRVTSEGFMETDCDISPAVEYAEVRRIHHG